MKIASIADIHAINKIPKYRTAQYPELIISKLNHVIKSANKENCAVLTISGDLFDYWDISFSVYSKIAYTLSQFEGIVIVIPGQHDLRWHTSVLSDSPIGALESSGIIKVPTMQHGIVIRDHVFQGLGWHEENVDYSKLEYNIKMNCSCQILLIHKLVTKKKGLYASQEEGEYATATKLLQSFPYHKYIISGDNHETFMVNYKNRALINPGSIMRKRKDQIEHKPSWFLIDTKKDKVVQYSIPILPAKQVFLIEKIESENRKEGAKELMDSFIETMEDAVRSPKFFDVLKARIKAENLQKYFVQLINERIDQALIQINEKKNREV